MMKKRKRLIIITILLLMLALAVGCNQGEPLADEVVEELEEIASYMDRASEQLVAGNLELALTYFEQAILYGEDLPLAWRGVGMIQFKQNQFGDARIALETALELGGEESAIIYNMLGVTAMRTSDFEAAIDFFDTGIVWFELTLGRAGMSLSQLAQENEPRPLEEGLNIQLIQSMMANRILAHQSLANWEEARELASEYLQIFPDDTVMQREYEFLQTR